jgi:hypothetical protein
MSLSVPRGPVAETIYVSFPIGTTPVEEIDAQAATKRPRMAAVLNSLIGTMDVSF